MLREMLPDSKFTLTATVAASLSAANIAASKIASIPLGVMEVTVPAGFIGIAIAFLATDLLGEIHGKESARKAVNGAIVSLLAAYTVVFSAVAMPAAPFYQLAEPFAQIMGQSGHIVLASIATLLVSQNIDVSAFHKLKSVSDYKAVRNIGSTAISQAVDTVLFIGLGFVLLPMVLGGGAMALSAAASLAFGQYVAKLLIVIADTPIFYAAAKLMEE